MGGGGNEKKPREINININNNYNSFGNINPNNDYGAHNDNHNEAIISNESFGKRFVCQYTTSELNNYLKNI